MIERKRILIAEDDPSILKMTKLRLEHEGYDVVAVMDGEEALQQAAAQTPIHVILLDIKLPKLNGYDVCRALKHQPATADIPVIVFSASETHLQRLADRCIEVGATDWIKKPFRTKDLLTKIHRALGEKGGWM
jgi:CheY-like chemotaxis protein